MGEMSFKEMLKDASNRNFAVGAFNIFNYISAKAVMDAAQSLCAPVIIQTSTSTVRQFGSGSLIDMLNILRKNRPNPILIHLDHCTSIDLAKECIDCGWDSVMIDLSAKRLEENMEGTIEVKQYAQRKHVDVESELGIISGTEDDIHHKVENQPKYEDAVSYLEKVKVDAFAPAIGTAHGVYEKAAEINYELIRQLRQGIETPIVIHGGTGLSTEQFKELIDAGGSKINISTALKQAYYSAIRGFLSEYPNEKNPLKLDAVAEHAIYQVAQEHIKCFRSDGKC